MTRAIEKRLEISHDEAEKMKINLDQAPDSNEERWQKSRLEFKPSWSRWQG